MAIIHSNHNGYINNFMYPNINTHFLTIPGAPNGNVIINSKILFKKMQGIDNLHDNYGIYLCSTGEQIGTYITGLHMFKVTKKDVGYVLSNTLIEGLYFHEYFQSIRTLFVEFCNITTLDNFPPFLEVLMCGQNKLTVLENLPSTIKSIMADHNNITHIDLSDIESLEILNLSHNKLGDSHENMIILPDEIDRLTISDNQLTSLFNFSLHHKTIKTLDMSNNAINHIICDLLPETLELLIMRSNNLTKLNLTTPLSNNLKKIDVSSNQLTELTGMCPSLTELNVTCNSLQSLDIKCPNLKEFFGSTNRFTSMNLPKSVFYLHVMNNPLREFTFHDNMKSVYIPSKILKIVHGFKHIKDYARSNILISDIPFNILEKHIAKIVILNFFKRIKRRKYIFNNIFDLIDENERKKECKKITIDI